MLSKAAQSRIGIYLSSGKALGGGLDVMGAGTGSGGPSARVRSLARAAPNEGGNCFIEPQLVSHPPRRREDRQEQGWRAFGWGSAVGRLG